ncbi:MAG: hypothetical protein V3T72_22075, partial [Thermoanaerobaculia bacterium]
MKRLAAPALLFLTGWCGAAPSEPAAGPMTLVDRIVAVVDEDPVFLSDVERIIGLGLAEPAAGETSAQLRRRVLDGLVDQRLRFHEVERYDFGPLPLEQIEDRLEEIRSRFPDRQSFAARLSELGLSEPGLRHILTRQLRVLIYVQERLTPRVFVDPEDVRDYYDRVLRPRAEVEGIKLPPLEDERLEIRKILRDVRLNEQIEMWTEELRLEAEIVDHLDRPPQALP